MPVYEYGCESGHRFEVKQKFSDAPITTCQFCDLPVSKLISAPAITFKGSGWYVTDYSDKMKAPATEAKSDKPVEAKKEGAEKPAADGSPPAAPPPSPAGGASPASDPAPTTPSGS